MKNFLHLKFVRNLKSDLEILQEQKKIMNYLLFDYFDYLLVEQADNLQECAFGIKSPEKRQELCEAYQGLGIFCLQDQTEQVEIKPNLIRAYPFAYGDGDMPFLSIFQLTLNPYYYKKEQETEADEWIETLKTKILDSFDENKDSVAFQIYQTVNAIDFCIIVVSKHLAFTERLSNNLKRCTFDLDKNKYLAFTVYENVGIHRDVKDDLIEDAFSGQHALVARVKVKDHYWSGLKGEYSNAIEKSIVDVVSDTSLHPILERMRGCIDGETTQSCNENIGFVKNSLNYIFEESFSDISQKEKEDRKNQILKEEIRFMMKYYYKNRRRYMEEDKGI